MSVFRAIFRRPGGALAFGASPVALTRLFETIVTYDTLGTTFINLSSKRLHVIDLAAIAGSVAVHFPAATNVGECIGISLLTSGAGSDAVTFGSGNVSLFSPLSADTDCTLWSWDGAAWQLVSIWIEAGYPFLQHQFVNGDLTAGALVVTHNLSTLAPIVQLYDNGGNLVAQDLKYDVAVIDQNSFTLTLSGVVLPITGTWTVTVAT